MTQKEKNLVLIDLCGRLPYGIKIKEEYGDYINVNIYNAHIEHLIDRVVSGLDKMVLRPMSSMTEEEINKVQTILGRAIEVRNDFINNIDTEVHTISFLELQAVFNFLNMNHFDYNELIPKGLAIEAPEGMY